MYNVWKVWNNHIMMIIIVYQSSHSFFYWTEVYLGSELWVGTPDVIQSIRWRRSVDEVAPNIQPMSPVQYSLRKASIPVFGNLLVIYQKLSFFYSSVPVQLFSIESTKIVNFPFQYFLCSCSSIEYTKIVNFLFQYSLCMAGIFLVELITVLVTFIFRFGEMNTINYLQKLW